ncbi:MAG TPA: BatA domain-containing protein, partial [Pirellulaceae bacterium]|nr:BatA domain-containing protein [Pirellulaceae bacterium]
MSVLFPLYLAGLAALTLPLILHLVRRTPKGRKEFSSLMFLAPSPPRLTRRSRLDQILLLLLRLAALAFLAFAFARPFLRQEATLSLANLPSRR